MGFLGLERELYGFLGLERELCLQAGVRTILNTKQPFKTYGDAELRILRRTETW
jgi:hypothetical protein